MFKGNYRMKNQQAFYIFQNNYYNSKNLEQIWTNEEKEEN